MATHQQQHAWNVAQWLDYIEQCHPETIVLGLDRIKKVLAALNFPGFVCPVIKVAGTNGKGSTVALLSSIYRHAGYQVGTYTSPHVLTYNERIQINQEPISDQRLITLFEQIERARGSVALTYFEYGTIAAFLYFLEHPLDVIILEIGMGGRLDAVNVIPAELSIITNIDLDHCDWLGDSKEAIAYEKAGIIDHHTHVICGDLDPLISKLIVEHASLQHATSSVVDKDYVYQNRQDTFDFLSLQPNYPSEVALAHPQLAPHNAAMAVMATKILAKHLPVTRSALDSGLADAVLIGRQQKYCIEGVDVWLDVAHNPHAITALAARLRAHYHPNPAVGHKKFHLLFGMMKDKDVTTCLKILHPCIDVWHFCDLATTRAAKAIDIQMAFNDLYSHASNVHCHPSIRRGYQVAHTAAQPNDVIIACGSFLVVAEMVSMVSGLP